MEFVWSWQNDYAIRTDKNIIKVFKGFKEHKSFATNFPNEGLFGGRLLGVKSSDFVTFYDWDTFNVVRRIDIDGLKNVYWSDNGNFVVLALAESFYLLKFNQKVLVSFNRVNRKFKGCQ